MNANNINMDKEIIEVSLDDILPNRFQPRLTFDQNSLNELATSIKEHGIIQPLVVRRLGDKFEIIAGERRYKAAIIAGLKRVPVVIMNLNDNESAEIAIVENIQRKEMTPLEEAKSYKKLLDRGYLTQEQLAVRMGKSQSSIANKLRLLNLTEEVQDALLNEKISERHARSLLSVKSPEDQKKILTEILSNKLTVKQTDDLIKQRYGVNTPTEDDTTQIPPIKNLQSYASTAAFIPNPYAGNEPNPQLNIINQLNKVQPLDNNVQDIIQNVPAQPFNDQFNQNVPEQPFNNQFNQNIPSQSFNNPINQIEPIKQINENIIDPIDIDINKLKQEAHDISKPTPPPVDMSNLLKNEQKDTTSAPIEEARGNRFIFDFDDLGDVKTETIAETIPPMQEQTNEVEIGNVKSAIDMVKKDIETLKDKGFRVTTEEFDYEKLYQLIIKIDK